MPEGHTLRKLADDLAAAFAGRTVRVSSPQGRFAADAEQLDGARLLGADSAGKHLFVELEGERFVHVHLGLIGTFSVHAGVVEVPEPVGAVRLRLVSADDHDPRGTSYADLRGAILCDLVGPDRRAEVLGGLGPDPLRADADPDVAWRRISRSHRTIGDLLMDQKVLAGVGNVYRAELLHVHHLHPEVPAVDVPRDVWDSMWATLVARFSIRLQSTFSSAAERPIVNSFVVIPAGRQILSGQRTLAKHRGALVARRPAARWPASTPASRTRRRTGRAGAAR